MLFENRVRAESFGAVAEVYDRARPSYPSALVDALLADGARRVLDVGCGTGIAGVLFAARGCEVLGVEIDPRMAAIARSKRLEVEVAGFEQWEDRGRRFDLLVSGQAWHWIDPRAGALRAAAVLRRSARIGLFWNFADLPGELAAELRSIYRRLAPELEDSVLLGNHDSRNRGIVRGIDQSGEFLAAELHRFTWSRRYETGEWLEHLSTHSDHQTLPAGVLEELLGEIGAAVEALGGGVEVAYQTVLLTSRRK